MDYCEQKWTIETLFADIKSRTKQEIIELLPKIIKKDRT
jgi:hypothetical protein